MKRASRHAEPLRDRLLDGLASYLPLLLMALLALGSWWLVSKSPVPEGPRKAGPLLHIADYSMTRFTVQRFDASGRLSSEVSGDRASHYPDTATLEIDNPRLRSVTADGFKTQATALLAVSSDDGQRFQLIGNAHVVRQMPGQPDLDFHGDQLRADLRQERFESSKPVRLSQGGATWTASGFLYHHASQRVELTGPIRAVLPPRGR